MNSFEKLNKTNVNEYIEKKKVNGKELSYLSWANAWAELKKEYPEATYIIKKFGNNQLPYVYDENTGYMVFTEVTIENLTYEMWLFVMDGANKAMKNEKYEYEVKEYNYGKPTGKMIKKSVELATMFDINTTIMRCLVKNLAMFGLGLYIYAGEDLPEGDKEDLPENPNKKCQGKQVTVSDEEFENMQTKLVTDLVTDKEVQALRKMLQQSTPELTLKNINGVLSKYNKFKLEELLMTEYVAIVHYIEDLKKKKEVK